ncbi:hypothetical protein [Kribbella shirazensis]|uniref:Mce-associated membrane protein n=1 Tax=Kribbella shirazensis TaxID=1105143 RepID=A0A7X5V9K3_9ACTN|nr:hypothetical protein [Kribbella shirazensis]NIK56467.1 Mce-associated membrane protein [Kribbella shirazensis]
MPNPRNRPRVAGQRRTAKPGKPDVTATGPDVTETAPETPEVVDERSAEDVTPSTSEVSEVSSEESSVLEASTESEQEPEYGVVPETPRAGLGTALTVALGVVVVLTLTVAAVLGVKAWNGKQAEDARNQAAAAGRTAAETALSYDYRDLDKSFAAARATMTPDFAAKFDETAKVAGELATKTKATVKADVREVGVRDGDADRVTLIIFVNQTTTSTITKGSPRVDLNRTRFTMVRNDGRWLVQEIAGL